MNVTALARKLKTTTTELFDVLPQLGFDIGRRAIKINDSTANVIISNWPRYKKQLEVIKAQEAKQRIADDVTKEKKQTNVRAAGSDDAIALTPPTLLSLEQSIDFLEDDELLEATPKSLRLRKRILNSSQRAKARKS